MGRIAVRQVVCRADCHGAYRVGEGSDGNSTKKSTTLTGVREENTMRQSARIFVFFLSVAIGAASQYAQAANSA